MTQLAQRPHADSPPARDVRFVEVELPVGAVLAHLQRRGICPAIPQQAVVRSGTLAVRMPSGKDEHFGPGDLVLLGPGQDAWTIGQQPCRLAGAIPT